MKLSFLDLLNLFGFSVSSMVITCTIFYAAYSNIYDKNFKNTQLLAFAINNVQNKVKQQQEEIDFLKEQLNKLLTESYCGSVEDPPAPPHP
jgi:hypothetical protein